MVTAFPGTHDVLISWGELGRFLKLLSLSKRANAPRGVLYIHSLLQNENNQTPWHFAPQKKEEPAWLVIVAFYVTYAL